MKANVEVLQTEAASLREDANANNCRLPRLKRILTIPKTMLQVNVNQEAKQTVTGYGILSLPKNACKRAS